MSFIFGKINLLILFISVQFTDIRLAYCDVSGSGTCCTKNMESKLSTNSRVQLEHNTKEMIGKLASVLSVRANRFNGN